ncbi:type II secretion system minor pseudopilin GspH [Solimonas sp. SE-A11]|uniref:type II secretion system minor pseudopilin GspH n=1 Tax=Solimonas sp. SE-A11 TaxID=3054954 RepID=UPI00259CABAF|nr:type II secretion system minor pseudopilin GspH [Solimonas sp. SE-A11]MDM4772240.1 type II secretion system minor pseudopilin GspH [Solimonas sp. SE-A11]
MRRSPAFRPAAPAALRGFTLLELLVVIVIIGVMLSFITLPFGGRSVDDRIEFEARRLDRTLRFALEEAEIKGVLIGFRYLPDRYEFLGMGQDGKWEPYQGGGPFRVQPFAAPLGLQLRVEDRVVPPAQDKEGDDEESEPKPQILLLPSGEVTAFHLVVGADGSATRYTIESDALGKFTFEAGEGKRK